MRGRRSSPGSKAWIADPEIDVVISTGWYGCHRSRCDAGSPSRACSREEDRRASASSSAGSRIRRSAPSTIQSPRHRWRRQMRPISSPCPARPSAARDGWEEILKFQLDNRLRPLQPGRTDAAAERAPEEDLAAGRPSFSRLPRGMDAVDREIGAARDFCEQSWNRVSRKTSVEVDDVIEALRPIRPVDGAAEAVSLGDALCDCSTWRTVSGSTEAKAGLAGCQRTIRPPRQRVAVKIPRRTGKRQGGSRSWRATGKKTWRSITAKQLMFQ